MKTKKSPKNIKIQKKTTPTPQYHYIEQLCTSLKSPIRSYPKKNCIPISTLRYRNIEQKSPQLLYINLAIPPKTPLFIRPLIWQKIRPEFGKPQFISKSNKKYFLKFIKYSKNPEIHQMASGSHLPLFFSKLL